MAAQSALASPATPRNFPAQRCEAVQPTLIQIEVPLAEVARKATLGKAIEYCAELAGYDYGKELEEAMRRHGVKCDETQLTRWKKGDEGIKVEKFFALMDVCGNDAPLMWLLHARGYDLGSLHRRESELERENRLLREERAALLRALQGAN